MNKTLHWLYGIRDAGWGMSVKLTAIMQDENISIEAGFDHFRRDAENCDSDLAGSRNILAGAGCGIGTKMVEGCNPQRYVCM